MYKLRALEIVLFVILVIGSASACTKNSKQCRPADKKCFLNLDLPIDMKDLVGESEDQYYPCDSDTFSITLDIFAKVPICVELLVLKDNHDCNGIRFKKVEILDCGKVLYIEIEKSKACVLKGIVTIYVKVGKVNVEKNKAKPNLLGELLELVLGPKCKADNKHESQSSGISSECQDKGGSPLGGVLGLLKL